MKRGEMTTQQIVGLIVLITAIVIILYFFLRADLTNLGQEELCHNSIVSDSSFVLSSISGAIDCKTTYLCFTKDSECSGFLETEIITVKNKEDLLEEISEKMLNCWWMFGEGELDYGKKCGVCNVIKIEESFEESVSYFELLDYLEINLKEQNQTYLNYLFMGASKQEILLKYFNLTQENLQAGEEYAIISGISSDGYIPAIPVKNNLESYNELKCEEVITKLR